MMPVMVDTLSYCLYNQSQPTNAATIGVARVDGSGTRTGVTLKFLSSKVFSDIIILDVWKGAWSPYVGTFSSN